MAGERGWIKVDVVEYENGSKVSIRLEKSTGTFKAVIRPANKDGEEERWGTPVFLSASKDLEKVKEETLAYLKETDTIEWEAIIIVKAPDNSSKRGDYSWDSNDHDISLDYTRRFRGKRKNGDTLWREFNVRDDDDGELEIAMEDRNGSPPHYQGDDNTVELPYTLERWSSLRTLTKLIVSLSDRIGNEFANMKKADSFLGRIAKGGPQGLMFKGDK